MKKFERNLKLKSSPTFIAKDPCIRDSINDSDYNFNEDLIDEHIGVSIVPVMMSPHNQGIETPSYSRSIKQVLRSIQNIENTLSCNNLSQKDSRFYDNKSSRRENGENEFYRDNDPEYSTSGHKFQSNRLEINSQQRMMKKQKKLKTLKQELENREMKQCTFSPNTHARNKKAKTPKRNLQQFLKSQQQYVSKVEKKREELRIKAEKSIKQEECFKPKINKSSNVVTERNRGKKPIYERLYQLKQSKIQKNPPLEQQQKSNANKQSGSNVNKPLRLHANGGKRATPISDLLYEDAERRQNLAKTLDKSKGQLDNSSVFKNKNNEKYASQKFIKQFCYILEQMKLLYNPFQLASVEDAADFTLQQDTRVKQENIQLYKKQFTQEQFNNILREMGFLLYDEDCQTEIALKERNLAGEAYHILGQYSVNIRNICIFLLSLLGIYSVNPINFYDEVQISRKSRVFELDQKQGKRLHKYFDLLYRNRLTSKSSQMKRSYTPVNKPASPSPASSNYISPRHEQHTKELATKYRSKMVQRANQRFISNNIDIHIPNEEMLTHQDLLVIDSLGRNLELKKIRQDLEMYLDDECTFHPKINSKGGLQSGYQTDRGIQKSKQLYEHAKNKHYLQKMISNRKPNHEQSQISQISRPSTRRYKQNQKQNIESKRELIKHSSKANKENKENQLEKYLTKQSKSISSASKTNIQYAKDVDKAVARMALGRKQRELKNKLLQRGEPDYSYTNKKSITKSSKNSHLESQLNHNHSSIDFNHNTSTNTFQVLNTQIDVQQYADFYEQNAVDEPFLVIDVNMGEQTQQIQFFTGDQKNVGKIVDQFCMDYDLDDQCKDQLLQMVQMEIEKYLNNVGVESTDCRQES